MTLEVSYLEAGRIHRALSERVEYWKMLQYEQPSRIHAHQLRRYKELAEKVEDQIETAFAKQQQSDRDKEDGL